MCVVSVTQVSTWSVWKALLDLVSMTSVYLSCPLSQLIEALPKPQTSVRSFLQAVTCRHLMKMATCLTHPWVLVMGYPAIQVLLTGRRCARYLIGAAHVAGRDVGNETERWKWHLYIIPWSAGPKPGETSNRGNLGSCCSSAVPPIPVRWEINATRDSATFRNSWNNTIN